MMSYEADSYEPPVSQMEGTLVSLSGDPEQEMLTLIPKGSRSEIRDVLDDECSRENNAEIIDTPDQFESFQ